MAEKQKIPPNVRRLAERIGKSKNPGEVLKVLVAVLPEIKALEEKTK